MVCRHEQRFDGSVSTTADGFEITSCSACAKEICQIPSSDARYRESLMARWDIWKTGEPQRFSINHEIVDNGAGERHICQGART
jgi:hypothetical protein